MYTEDTRLFSIRTILMYGACFVLAAIPFCIYPFLGYVEKAEETQKEVTDEMPIEAKYFKKEPTAQTRCRKYNSEKTFPIEKYESTDMHKKEEGEDEYLSLMVEYLLTIDHNTDTSSEEFFNDYILELVMQEKSNNARTNPSLSV
ncbi:hypothetical protein NERG_01789 [Nematocida ausubeli]|uniref:Uncharacterized protein n=1 Tax=Nematocida ausubeli (strain ATCC PRA-371 / ERTm2) TaxID=1913371 RepID=H8ZDW8_NEMA1|nr:hypothetical protein NERG_01789 [Nematocida ausubeli]